VFFILSKKLARKGEEEGKNELSMQNRWEGATNVSNLCSSPGPSGSLLRRH